MPTISVIIPTYNRAGMLHRSIESVLAQTFEDFELLVVDDGSTDETESVVRRYDDDRIQYLCHEENQGASAARNTGIEHATGRYVALLDSDDEWFPRKLERQVEELEGRSDEWIAAYCAVELAEDGTLPARAWRAVSSRLGWSRLSETEGAEGGSELIKDILLDDLHTSAGSTLLVRREVVEVIDGFDESFDRFQDPEFLIRVLHHGKLAYVDEPLVRRYDTGRPPAEVMEESDRQYLDAFSETVSRLERQGHDIHGAHHYFLAKFYFEDGKFREGISHLRRARNPRPRQYPGLLRSFFPSV